MTIDPILKQQILESLKALKAEGYKDPVKLVEHAKFLRNLSFDDVLDLKITNNAPSRDFYNKKNSGNKGGLGNLIQEHYFSIPANSNAEPDFANANMELKVSPIEYGNNRSKQWVIKASERLSLTMIPYKKGELPSQYEGSPLEKKISDILLINYLRNKSIDKTEQSIKMINRLQISGEDLEIIKADYEKIASMVLSGRAHELSEGMTNYLGACTKGDTAKKSFRKQAYPLIHKDGREEFIDAKSRAFSFKKSYMDSVIQRFEEKQIHEDEAAIINDPEILKSTSLEKYALSLLKPFIGTTEKELRSRYGRGINNESKNYYAALITRMFGFHADNIAEFRKANIHVRTVKVNKRGKVDQHTKLQEVKLNTIHDENCWEHSKWYTFLTEARILFIVFAEDPEGKYRLKGGFFWSAPLSDIGSEYSSTPENTAYGYWVHTKKILDKGVHLTIKGGKVFNNFINPTAHPFCHIRPSANNAAYQFTDDRPARGNVEADAERLPDGQWMTKQAFWLNKDYVKNLLINEKFITGV